MHRSTRWLRRGAGAAAFMLLVLEVLGPVLYSQPQKSWRAGFTRASTVKAAGEYQADIVWNFESFSPVCLEPSGTGTFTVARIGKTDKNHVVFHETRAPLRKNPTPPPFYVRGEGSISALGWVAGEFENLQLSGEVNTAGRSTARQGLLARWDHGNNFYWFYVNFTSGTVGIMRSRFFGVMDDLPGSVAKIKNFARTKSYLLEFELNGSTLQGKASEIGPGDQRTLVADTGAVKDPEPHMKGVSGFLAEPSPERPFDPLRASFAAISATAR
jgi:hypothetical protein